MEKSLLKDSIRQIKNTLKRFLSIVAIVLLGVGFFVGITATSPDMKDTVDKYFDDENVMDIEIISTLGLTDEDIEALKQVEGTKDVVGTYSIDATFSNGKKEYVVKIESMPNEINNVILQEGNLPQNANECVVESSLLTWTDYKIGDYITLNPQKVESSTSLVDIGISGDDEQTNGSNMENNKPAENDSNLEENSDEDSTAKNKKVKIVGTVQSPLYISRSRGSSKLGSGSVNYYMYMPKENFNMDVYTIAYITVDGAKDLKTYSDEYKDKVKGVIDNIEDISDERKQARYNCIVNNAQSKLDDAQKEYDEQKQKAEDELQDAQNKIDNGKAQIEAGEKELKKARNQANTEFENADKKLEEAEEQLNSAKTEFETKKQETEKQLSEAQKNVDNLNQVKSNYENLKKQKKDIESQVGQIEESLKALNQNPEVNADKITELTKNKATLEATISEINAMILQIETSLSNQGIQDLSKTIASINSQIEQGKQELLNAENTINQNEKELESQKEKLAQTKTSTYNTLKNNEQKLENSKQEIAENEQKLEDARKETQEKLDEAQEKLNDAKTQIAKIEKPTWYILDRNSNYGYAEYIQDTDRIGNLAKVFPIVFFLVAALISLTSMSRMIEEQRVQIGTLKALGYNKIQISFKYIIYAFLATIIGGIAGMIIGFKLLPAIITMMYGMMYTLPKAECVIRMDIGMLGLGFALICTLGATIYTCVKELKEKPAELMLPKAPKPGKRIMLEKITFIWRRLKFTNKVTARNVFRYKKKMLMTVIGVAGCTSLIIAGFGIRNAIGNMIPNQYGEIFKYDGTIEFKDGVTKTQIQEENEKVKSLDKIEDTLPSYMKTVEITSIQNSQTINLVVPEQTDKLDEFIGLRSRKHKKETYTLDDESVIISEKIANLLKIKVGDTITIKNTDDIEKDVKVGAITENYIYHFMYMSSNLYNKLYGENTYKPNTLLIKEVEGTTEDDEETAGKTILQDDTVVAGVSFLSGTKDIFADVMDKMQLVVYILIISAGLLAFAVLYNLSNVNISERIRELATIKVLGFYDKEVFNYITKETRILTVLGIFLGLFGGYFLSMFAVKTCELDMIMFNYDIGKMCFIYGIAITIIFAEIVNLAVNRTLKKISMTESLKSVD